MPAASAVNRSPRVASSTKSVLRCRSRIFFWWTCSAFHEGRAVSGNIPVIVFLSLARLVQDGALRSDHFHEIAPGRDERRGAFVLKLVGEGIHVDAGRGEPSQYFVAVAAIGGEDLTQRSMIGEGLQGALGHGVHGERRGERLYIKEVRGPGILGARARPQQTLRAGAGIEDPLPAGRVEYRAVRLVGPLRDCDAEPIVQRLRYFVLDRRVPPADEHRGDRADLRLEPRGH